jgi:hypothetical protein
MIEVPDYRYFYCVGHPNGKGCPCFAIRVADMGPQLVVNMKMLPGSEQINVITG